MREDCEFAHEGRDEKGSEGMIDILAIGLKG